MQNNSKRKKIQITYQKPINIFTKETKEIINSITRKVCHF